MKLATPLTTRPATGAFPCDVWDANDERVHVAHLIADHARLTADLAEMATAARALLDRENQWDDDEEPETSEAARSRNEHVRLHKRLRALVARVEART